MSIPVFRPTLRRRDLNSVLSCLVSDRIGSGPLNHELAGGLAHYLGTAGGVCLATYSAAIQLALQCLELAAGDGVIVSALAPSVYLHALAARGLVALVVDVDPATGLLAPSEVQRCLAFKPRAVVLHYTLGFLPDAEDLFGLGLPVIEDISQALGASLGAVRCGSLGAVSVLSLGPQGILTAGCGAGVFARDRRLLKNLREAAERGPQDLGLADMNAALGLAQLRELDRFLKIRQAMAEAFSEALSRSRHGALRSEREGGNVQFSFPVLVRDGVKQVRQYAMKKGIETASAFAESIAAVGGSPVEEGAEDSSPEGRAGRLPHSRDLLWRCLLFPLYPTLMKRDVQLIARILSTLP